MHISLHVLYRHARWEFLIYLSTVILNALWWSSRAEITETHFSGIIWWRENAMLRFILPTYFQQEKKKFQSETVCRVLKIDWKFFMHNVKICYYQVSLHVHYRHERWKFLIYLFTALLNALGSSTRAWINETHTSGIIW